MVGMLCGFLLNVYLWQCTEVPFTWYVALGSTATFVIGYLASFLPFATDPAQEAAERLKLR
jgi:hypothetical protein